VTSTESKLLLYWSNKTEASSLQY